VSVTYSEKVKQSLSEAELAFVTATTSEILNDYPYPPVEAAWDVSKDPEGHTIYTIQAHDPEENAQRRLEPDEVTGKHDLRYHLFRLLGELLRHRSEKLIRVRREFWSSHDSKN
jgi:hypothetical protein